ncbi:MAG: prolipoprotein diacylglyceryl transferase [Mycolicibacterium insubricum]|uniref:Phosphatidylglycerol--prolipoprotein diacylglyceryl transferase n=1 Tax=Mycolicibacterium insubricum TaxID=444597 RepID=A0A1X0DGE7_9MYCO|nr:prolipoprotein diacylglyceryl transferase [Mycolicibacterium insubricum]ORA71476.1 prolipoprotein diacylglyceryl transferase [Mycolicibacterium insubricum]BBZ67105.1 prolipoprotein diacylglyceryl transferase [Mycolicibacterium insubricum]
MTTTLLAAFPSPPRGVWYLGPVPLRAYALFIIAGIIAALVIGDRRWVARGGEPGVIYDIALWAVPFGLIGGRLYHVMTDWRLYFGANGKGLLAALQIWEGGLGIWGAVALGAVGAWIACRRRGIPLPAFGDAIAPGIILAQAIGRLGNYFNQELYGRPTDLPWGMEIFDRGAGCGNDQPLNGVSTGEVCSVVQPTFLYELLWNLLVFVALIVIDRRYRIGHGRLFALYVAGYCVGRFGVELLRADPALTQFDGIRINSFTSTFVFIGAVVYFILAPKGREDPATLSGDEPVESLADEVRDFADEFRDDVVAAAAGTGLGAAVLAADDAEDAEAADEAESAEDAEAAEKAAGEGIPEGQVSVEAIEAGVDPAAQMVADIPEGEAAADESLDDDTLGDDTLGDEAGGAETLVIETVVTETVVVEAVVVDTTGDEPEPEPDTVAADAELAVAEVSAPDVVVVTEDELSGADADADLEPDEDSGEDIDPLDEAEREDLAGESEPVATAASSQQAEDTAREGPDSEDADEVTDEVDDAEIDIDVAAVASEEPEPAEPEEGEPEQDEPEQVEADQDEVDDDVDLLDEADREDLDDEDELAALAEAPEKAAEPETEPSADEPKRAAEEPETVTDEPEPVADEAAPADAEAAEQPARRRWFRRGRRD